MFFGEYLVKNNVITTDQLVAVMAKQQEKAPSILQILLDRKLMAPEQILSVIIEQAKTTGADILSVIRDSKLLTPEELEEVFKDQATQGVSFIETIKGLEIASWDEIQNCFVDFIKSGEGDNDEHIVTEAPVAKPTLQAVPDPEKDGPAVNNAALESLQELVNSGTVNASAMSDVGKETAPEPAIASKPKVNNAALESLQELVSGGTVDASAMNDVKAETETNTADSPTTVDFSFKLAPLNRDFIAEYLSIFNEKEYNKLHKIVKIMLKTASNNDEVGNFINSFYRDMQVLKGAASLAEAEISLHFITCFEDLCERLLKKDKENLISWIQNFSEPLDLGIDILWETRNGIANSQEEAEIWSNTLFQEKYNNCFTKIQELK